MGVQISFWNSYFTWINRVELLDNLVVLFFEKPPYCFPQWLNQFVVPSTVRKCSLSHILTALVTSCVFDNTIPTSVCVWAVVSHCGFHLHFLVEWFSCICWLFVFFGKMSIQILCSFLIFFFSIELCEFLYILEIAFSQLHKARPATENLLFILPRALPEVCKCLKCARLCTFGHSAEWSQLYTCARAWRVETQVYCLRGVFGVLATWGRDLCVCWLGWI